MSSAAGLPNGKKTDGVTSYPPPTQAQIDETTRNIRSELQRLRLDDITVIAKQQIEYQTHYGVIIDTRITWIRQTLNNFYAYLLYLLTTWHDAFASVFKANIDFGDQISIFSFSIATSLILAAVWLWCAVSTHPLIVWLYKIFFTAPTGGLSLVNGMNPNLFVNLTQDQALAAKEELSKEIDPHGHNPRIFSLDVAKFLLQIASLMYERDDDDLDKEVNSVVKSLEKPSSTSNKLDSYSFIQKAIPASTATPGELYQQLSGGKDISSALGQLGAAGASRSVIDDWATSYGICFEPVSELASLSQSYCSVFWDPASTWVVVAFKGTDPRSFEEWATDFTASFADIRRDIGQFHHVHKGFKERIFPTDVPEGTRQPWTTISAAVKVVVKQLTKYRPGAKINVWFTGHSLGTALATLAYSKALFKPEDLGSGALLRDAYLFATPITADVPSKNAFNAALYANPSNPRTMWRVTNRDDFVATGLPAFGDQDKYHIDDDNLFGFAHLGIEIFMKSGPNPCQVKGNNLKGYGNFDIYITSKFTPEEVKAQRALAVKKGHNVGRIYLALQYIPLIGRLAAHAATNYYDQLDQIAIKGAVDYDGPL